jgi:oligopeptide/dipeptide ABC transporter ATP-binding protein
MSLLSVRDLDVKYAIAGRVKAAMAGLTSRHIDAVIGISFDLAAGKTLAVVGESGSGKSTLARAILGLTPFAAGSVTLAGHPPYLPNQHRAQSFYRDVAMMFQDPVSSLSPRRTVASLISEPFVVHGIKGKDLLSEVKRLLSLVGLPADFVSRYPHQLSGGQARRVGVARAIALNPKLIVADEPTAGLDVSVQGEILNLLARLQGEFGLTYMIITHNLAVVRHVSDETAIMYMGRFVEKGPTADIFAAAAHPYAAALIAAQPHPDPAQRRTEPALLGEVSSLRNRPSGCEFHPRCSRAQELCRTVVPQPQNWAAHREFRCHYPLIAGSE